MLKIIARAKVGARAVLIKKSTGMSVIASFLRLGALLRDNLQIVLFPNIDVCSYWLAWISEINNRLVTACIFKTAT